MLQYSVCTDAVFYGQSTVEAMRTVRRLGYSAFEFWGFEGKYLPAIAQEAGELGLTLTCCCARLPSLVDPYRRGTLLSGLEASLEAARTLGTRMLITQTGNDTGAPRVSQMESMAEALRLCGPMLAEAGVVLLVEPLNLRVDHSGYFLSTTDDAARLMRMVAHPQIKLLFDIYHQQLTEGDLMRNIGLHLGDIAHMHAAGCPGRHEMDTGEIHYPRLMRSIEEMGYTGCVGLEYIPQGEAEQGLSDWLKQAKDA